MSEPSFLDWYPRGRLAFLASHQSEDIRERIKFVDTVFSTLLNFLKIKSDIQLVLDASSFSDKNEKFPGFSPPAACQLPIDPECISGSHVTQTLRYFFSFSDYIRRFSGPLMADVVQHPFFQKALEKNSELACLSESPDLVFDRAIYAIDLGEGADPLMLDYDFPLVPLDPGVGMEGASADTVLINSIGIASAFLERDGKVEIFPVVATHPFFSKLSEDNRKAIHEFLQKNALCLGRLLETETRTLDLLVNYFTSGFESSVHLLKSRETFLPISGSGIDA